MDVFQRYILNHSQPKCSGIPFKLSGQVYRPNRHCQSCMSTWLIHCTVLQLVFENSFYKSKSTALKTHGCSQMTRKNKWGTMFSNSALFLNWPQQLFGLTICFNKGSQYLEVTVLSILVTGFTPLNNKKAVLEKRIHLIFFAHSPLLSCLLLPFWSWTSGVILKW